ncbi:hypothetical protein B296_00017830 [Ensete ventricosum]|uniref:Uncharacterized protein n=1 Tax=Ensete ventricosum TaxID=4639 RepID=A0A426YL76_ENSVE|nr:hypothetical protein B296_00017830 [Ensete ventricosum]
MPCKAEDGTMESCSGGYECYSLEKPEGHLLQASCKSCHSYCLDIRWYYQIWFEQWQRGYSYETRGESKWREASTVTAFSCSLGDCIRRGKKDRLNKIPLGRRVIADLCPCGHEGCRKSPLPTDLGGGWCFGSNGSGSINVPVLTMLYCQASGPILYLVQRCRCRSVPCFLFYLSL